MTRFVTLAVVAALGLPLAACGSDGTASQDGGLRIAFLAAGVDATYTPAQVSGLELGSGGKVTTFNPQFDPATQLGQCQVLQPQILERKESSDRCQDRSLCMSWTR